MRITGNQPVVPDKLALARKFRREMTTGERALWKALRTNRFGGIHFRRQQVIAGFIVDFYCASARLAIEVDGPLHLETRAYDAERDRALSEVGIRTLRLTDESARHNPARVLQRIAAEVKRLSQPNPLPLPMNGKGNLARRIRTSPSPFLGRGIKGEG